jgi:hypothetical protein
MNKSRKSIPADVLKKAIEIYARKGMVWQNVPAVLAEEFGMKDGDQLYHNHALCSAANDTAEYIRKRKKRSFISPSKTKAIQEALIELGYPITAKQLLEKAISKLPNKRPSNKSDPNIK